MTHLDKVLHTAKTHSMGGRDGGASATSVAIWTASFRLLAPRASVPKPGATVRRPLGRPASKSDRACGPQKKSRLPADVAIVAEVDHLANGGSVPQERVKPCRVSTRSRRGPGRRGIRDLSVLKTPAT